MGMKQKKSKWPTEFFKIANSQYFFVKISWIGPWAFFISIENFYLVEKQNKENFMKKIRKLVDSEIVKTCDELDPKVFVPIRQVLRPQPHRFL